MGVWTRITATTVLSGFLLGAEIWERPRTPTLPAAGMRAKDCGACHTEIYDEWKRSTHALAWTDPQFQAEWHKDPAVGWLCLNCHTPVANQQAQLVIESGVVRDPAMQDNPAFDATWRDEGITCLTCHWRPDGIAAPHADVSAPHPTVHAPDLREASNCTSCHQAIARIEDALVCHFNTGSEWKEARVGRTCQECHMPTVERAVAPGAPVRTTRRHTWAGSGLGKGGIEPHPALSSLTLTLQAPDSARAGETVDVQFAITNSGAGHHVPTGDPERHLQVRAVVREAGGARIATLETRIGQVWEWSPVARQIEDNRIAPGETRTGSVRFEMPAKPARFEVEIEHVRITQANLDYHVNLAIEGHAGPTAAALRAYPTRRMVQTDAVTIALDRP